MSGWRKSYQGGEWRFEGEESLAVADKRLAASSEDRRLVQRSAYMSCLPRSIANNIYNESKLVTSIADLYRVESLEEFNDPRP
jgi:hypothetical protein